MYDRKFSELQEVNKITENLEQRVSQSFKGDVFFLEVKYKENFTINKTFKNNYDGREELKKAIENFNTEEKVKKYLGL